MSHNVNKMCLCVGGGGEVPGPSIITLPILLHGYNFSPISMYDIRKQSDKDFKSLNLKYEYLEGSGVCCAKTPRGTKLSVQEYLTIEHTCLCIYYIITRK